MEANQPLKGVSVYLGRHIRSSGGTKYGVKEATFHPGWMKTDRKRKKMGMAPFDLLLLRLDRAVTFSPTISPVCLPTVPEDRDAKSYNQKMCIFLLPVLNEYHICCSLNGKMIFLKAPLGTFRIYRSF